MLAVDEASLALPVCQQLALRLRLPVAQADSLQFTGYRLRYCHAHDRLEIGLPDRQAMPLFVDFSHSTLLYRSQRSHAEAVAKAVGARGAQCPEVIDATGGLGQDSFLIASRGCRVWTIERHPLIAGLLRDGLRRALADPALQTIAARITLLEGDARKVLHTWPATRRPATVYLDPMYPQRHKAALGKLSMRAFHELVGDDADAAALLELARRLARRRITVKRPRKAAPLGHVPPHSQLLGSSTRFDLYSPVTAGQ